VSESEASVPFEPGDLIAEKYRVERVLGAGGMGVVVEATHLDLDRKVAVKLIRQEMAQEPSTVERLMLEAKAAARIRSEHVGKVLDVGKLPSGAPYIVMEYLEGSDLCQLLEARGALKITQAVDFVMQACEALAEAHVANIVHRDLKPENLFVARQPDGSVIIKVLDFGISKQLGASERRQLTNPSTAVGSPRYMAPEQMQGTGVDVRADIWSLGAILYECLSNLPAFDSDTLPGICAQVLSQEPRSLRELAPHSPDRLISVIERCLKKSRDERFANVAQFAEAIAPFGTERADLSRRRITALLGGAASVDSTQLVDPSALIDAQGRTAVLDTGSVFAATAATSVASNSAPNNTVGRGVALDTLGTAKPPTRAVWPFIVAPVLLLGGGAAAFFLLGNPGSAEDTANPPSALAAPPVVPATTASIRELETVTPEPPIDEAAAAPSSTTPEVEPAGAVPDLETAGATTPNKGTPKKATSPKKPKEDEPPAAKKPADAWDPNSFGGRE
jgi:eukaryotic-like serine/threonine-protein kinase